MTHRVCKGPCARLLPLTADHWPTRSGKARYPWQPSYYLPLCRECQRGHLKALRDSKRPQDNAKRTVRRRAMREAVKGSLGMTEARIRASRAQDAAQAAELLRRRQLKAEAKRALYRPYDPNMDGIKRRILETTRAAWAKRSRRGLEMARESKGAQGAEEATDYAARLEEMRRKHRSA